MAARVDVWDPTEEGERIFENLRQSALEVSSVGLEDVPLTRADLLLMAGDAPGALGALKLLRDEGARGDVPVVLLGIPEGMTHPGDGPGFGAQAVFRRPVQLAPLLSRVLGLLSSTPRADDSGERPPVPEPTLQLSSPNDPGSSQVLLRQEDEDSDPPSWRPREPTMQLSGDPLEEDADREVSQVTETGRPRPPRTTAAGRLRACAADSGDADRSTSGTGSDVETSAHRIGPELEIPPERRASLAPWLVELFEAADRRVFPDRARIDIHLPAADEPPEELVPAELFDAPELQIDEPLVEDPIDAFTYIGGPTVPPPVLPAMADAEEPTGGPLGTGVTPVYRRPRRPEEARSRPPRVELTTRTQLPQLTTGARARGGDWPDDDTVLGRSTPSGDRRGSLGPGGALRLLWRVASLGLDTICELHLSRGSIVRLTFLGGRLRAFDGPIASSVLEGLRLRGRATERPTDEAGAQAVLQRHISEGRLGRFERDRLMREARERLLVRVVGAERADFILRRLDDTQPGRVLARARMMRRPLRAALVEVAREALSPERVARLLGPEQPGLALGPEREAGLAPAELTSELLELVVRMEGHTLAEFLAAAPTEPGLAGLLYALVAGDALVLTDPPDVPAPHARAAVVELIERAASRAADADYFAILGVERDAERGELERAYRERRAELLAVPLGALGLEQMADARAEALEALDEAMLVLGHDDRRRSYARALPSVLSGRIADTR